MNSSPELYEFEYLFECDAKLVEPDIPWFYSGATFSIRRDELEIEFSLVPEISNGEIKLLHNNGFQNDLEDIMSNQIIHEAINLVQRIKDTYPAFQGRTAKKEDILQLQDQLKLKLPTWFLELYSSIPIIDAEFSFQEDEADEDYDGRSSVMIGDIQSVLDEGTRFAPGMFLQKEEFIYFATCSHGSGDPIFLKLNSIDEPAVYRVYHDDISKVKVSEKLSEFLKNATP
ncbi:SMI1/KNR4 family protein [Paenibacillus sp. SN-8-1]|uniref:SMI1/KNR4 family protein n=1 Tax=Paenibacillus sp. SN-8-1 TaxID=3435409 RepID=UPI003D9A2B41